MAGVRGVRNPMPSKGGKPTGIFSTNGSQKKDPLNAPQSEYKKYTASEYRMEKVDPKPRDNGLK